MSNIITSNNQDLKGTHLARKIDENIGELISKYNLKPSLKAILIGDDLSSIAYLKSKQNKAKKLGISLDIINHGIESTEFDLTELINRLNKDKSANGIIIERPIPNTIDFKKIIEELDPIKDIDSATSMNLGRIMQGSSKWFPATADACLRILRHYNISLSGKNIVILGRSITLGLPLANMLIQKGIDATVTICHSKTEDLKGVCRNADILITAIGKPLFVDDSFVKKDSYVIDVGINYTEKGLCGDVDYSKVKDKVKGITPVPGGVGPVTVSILLENLVNACLLQEMGS